MAGSSLLLPFKIRFQTVSRERQPRIAGTARSSARFVEITDNRRRHRYPETERDGKVGAERETISTGICDARNVDE
jgi:hypothetical protein